MTIGNVYAYECVNVCVHIVAETYWRGNLKFSPASISGDDQIKVEP